MVAVTVEAGLALAGEGGGPQSMTRGTEASLYMWKNASCDPIVGRVAFITWLCMYVLQTPNTVTTTHEREHNLCCGIVLAKPPCAVYF